MQYLTIDFIVVLCLDLGEERSLLRQAEQKAGRIGSAFLALFFCWLCVPYLAASMGKYQTVLRFLPGDTVSLRLAMAEAADLDSAAACADRVLEQNAYIAEAYNVKAYAAAARGDIEQVMKNEDEVLRLEKYNVDRYRSYDRLLEYMGIQFLEAGNAEAAGMTERKRAEIRERLEALRGQTSPVAYKLRDAPVFAW